MNAMSGAGGPVIPENAPFSPAQRAWLNGFLAGLYGASSGGDAGMSVASSVAVEEDFPWHDPALEMEERLALADGRPFERQLMAAMAQLDCGQCGYLCQSYAEALASGTETSASLCVPGAKPTSKKVKELLAERLAGSLPPAGEAPAPAAPPATGMPVRVLAADRLTGAASAKDVRHVRIDLTPSGLAYEPAACRRKSRADRGRARAADRGSRPQREVPRRVASPAAGTARDGAAEPWRSARRRA